MALPKLYLKISDVNGVEPEKMRRLTGKIAAFNRKKSALTALNWKHSGVNSV